MPDNFFSNFARGMVDPGGLQEERINVNRMQAQAYQAQVDEQKRKFTINTILTALQGLPRDDPAREGLRAKLEELGVGGVGAGHYYQDDPIRMNPGQELVGRSAPGAPLESQYRAPIPKPVVSAGSGGGSGAGGRKLSALERKIQLSRDFAIRQGEDPDEAEAVTLGLSQQKVDGFGRIIKSSKISDEVEIVQGTELPDLKVIPPSSEGENYWKDVLQGTGIKANIAQGVQNVVSLLNAGTPFRETTESRTNMRLLTKTLQKAVMLSDRYAVTEQAQVMGMIPNPDMIFKAPEAARDDLIKVRAFLRENLNAIDREFQSQFTSEPVRRDLLKRSHDIRAALMMLGDGDLQQQSATIRNQNPYLNMTRDQFERVEPSRQMSEQELLWYEEALDRSFEIPGSQ